MADLLVYLLLWWALKRQATRVVAAASWDSPVAEGMVTQGTSLRHPGVDVVATRQGKRVTQPGAAVRAMEAGTVTGVLAGARGGWVRVAATGGHDTTYLHLKTTSVRKGQSVARGQPIGTMGADPLDAEHVVHVHIETFEDGRRVEPSERYPGLIEGAMLRG